MKVASKAIFTKLGIQKRISKNESFEYIFTYFYINVKLCAM